MVEQLKVYKCEHCGAMVEAVRNGDGELFCCGDTMVLLEENTTDAAQEKHVPVLEKIDGGYCVKVGSVAHPMTDEHLIEWIELIADGKAYLQFLKAGEAPEAKFMVEAEKVCVRAHCNLHGLWKG